MDTDVGPQFHKLRERIASDPDLAGIDLLSRAVPAVGLATQRVPLDELQIGDSRIGGLPDVPADFDWPRWQPPKERDDRLGQPWHPRGAAPLGFIAQIDLSVTPPIDSALPRSGWLCFFYDRYCEPWGYDPADRGSCRVVYFDCDRSKLVRADQPADHDPEHLANSCRAIMSVEVTLSDYLPEVEYDTDAFEACQVLRDELTEGRGTAYHHLLGHPQLIQNPMELECQFASNGIYCGNSTGYESAAAKRLEAGAADWRLLLQIDTDEDGPGWMWGDVGRIYFWIKKQDLAARRFEDVWLIFQCS